jgi:hypothetical protein
MNDLEELLERLGGALDDGLDTVAPCATEQARTLLSSAIHAESANTTGRGLRHGFPRRGGSGRCARTLGRFGHCRDVGYVAPSHPKLTDADVASPIHVQPMPARYYCIRKGISQPNVLRVPCDGRVPNRYFRLTGGASQLMAYISWIAREPVTNVNDSTYSIQVTNPRQCGGGEQGLSSTQSLIRAGTQITRDFEVSSRCAGTYQGAVLYEPSLGPTGQAGTGLPEPGAPGTYLVGRFSIVVR